MHANNVNNVVVEMEVDDTGGNLQDCVDNNQLVIDVLDMVLPKNFDSSSIIVSQDGCNLQISENEQIQN